MLIVNRDQFPLASTIGVWYAQEQNLTPHLIRMHTYQAMLQDDLVYAHSPTDIAAGIRKTRMQEIFAQVDSINELLGLRPIAASSLIGFPTALLFGLLILVSILVYFVVRRYSRRLSLERGRAESSKLWAKDIWGCLRSEMNCLRSCFSWARAF